MKTEREAVKLYMDKDLVAWVKEQARLRRCSMAQVYRDLIVKAMEGKDESQPADARS